MLPAEDSRRKLGGLQDVDFVAASGIYIKELEPCDSREVRSVGEVVAELCFRNEFGAGIESHLILPSFFIGIDP